MDMSDMNRSVPDPSRGEGQQVRVRIARVKTSQFQAAISRGYLDDASHIPPPPPRSVLTPAQERDFVRALSRLTAQFTRDRLRKEAAERAAQAALPANASCDAFEAAKADAAQSADPLGAPHPRPLDAGDVESTKDIGASKAAEDSGPGDQSDTAETDADVGRADACAQGAPLCEESAQASPKANCDTDATVPEPVTDEGPTDPPNARSRRRAAMTHRLFETDGTVARIMEVSEEDFASGALDPCRDSAAHLRIAAQTLRNKLAETRNSPVTITRLDRLAPGAQPVALLKQGALVLSQDQRVDQPDAPTEDEPGAYDGLSEDARLFRRKLRAEQVQQQ